jgi:hypothetical protein
MSSKKVRRSILTLVIAKELLNIKKMKKIVIQNWKGILLDNQSKFFMFT